MCLFAGFYCICYFFAILFAMKIAEDADMALNKKYTAIILLFIYLL